MKPFNLRKALLGDPVVTRGGRKVLQVSYMHRVKNGARLYAVIEEINGETVVFNFFESGRYLSSHEKEDHPLDLFMKSTTKSGWVIITEGIGFNKIYESKKEAVIDSGIWYTSFDTKIAKITWEE